MSTRPRKRSRRSLKRRTLLKGLTAVGLLSAAAPLISCGDGSEPAQGTVAVYRFQTSKANSCNACRNHKRYKVFVDEATADRNRAHAGCNCAIVTQQMPAEYWQSIASYEVDGVVDLRHVFA